MSNSANTMTSVKDAQTRVAAFYDRHARDWAADAFVGTDAFDSPALALHPPTEKQVIADGRAASAWARSWQDSRYAKFVSWVAREWPSAGHQEVPERLGFPTPEALATFIGRKPDWLRLCTRTEELAGLFRACVSERRDGTAEAGPRSASMEGPRDPAEAGSGKSAASQIRSESSRSDGSTLAVALNSQLTTAAEAIRRTAMRYAALDEMNWQMLVQMLAWLLAHPEAHCFVRELPVKGVDTKWLETHRGIVEPLYTAFSGAPALDFRKVPPLVRLQFLDRSIAPAGIEELSLPVSELNRLGMRPERVIVCENLVSTLALPRFAGTLAIHGGGYAVDILGQIEWLQEVPILYWGDLDSNGFAILDRLRHHHPAVTSVLMDAETLAAHRELCGIEPTPNRSALTLLTPTEQETLAQLLEPTDALRLEQERIEWTFALDRIVKGLARLG